MKLEEIPTINEHEFKNEFYGEWVEKNTYTIKAKFGIGETVEIINPPYPKVKYFNVFSIVPTIKKSGIEIYYKGESWIHHYHESHLKKVEKDSK